MNVRHLSTLAVLGALALGGCGSVTEGIDFHAPGSGWVASPSILGHSQIWVKAPAKGEHGSVLVLLRGAPVGTGKADIFRNPALGAKDTHLDKDENISICSGQPAQHVVASGTWTNRAGNSEPAIFEAMLTSVKGEQFIAIYMHPKNQPADPSAEAAIRSLCPKPA